MSHTPPTIDHARVTVMTFTSPPSLTLSRPWAGVSGQRVAQMMGRRGHELLVAAAEDVLLPDHARCPSLVHAATSCMQSWELNHE
jgi:hypothetical protein